jgi:PAS domain S-box-containing protein
MNENLPRILVVDDKSQNRLLISEYLEPLNVHIEEASSGKECLELLKSKDYTLVIMDVQMPGLSGFQVLEQMHRDKELEAIPVVFVSAVFNSEEYILKGIEIGAIDFIAKPINVNILQNKVNNFLKLYEKQKALDTLVKTLEDINKRLEDSERKFKRITQSASDGIIVLDNNYIVRFWNKAANIIFGYSRYEILSENFILYSISPSSHEEFKNHITSLLSSNENSHSNTISLTGRKKSGEEFPIEISLAYFLNTNEEINLTLVIRDITKRVVMEKEALKAKELRESNRVMKEFMDSVSHELRTPMNAILGISNMLISYNSGNLLADQREGLEIINQSGTRLLEMINDVLDVSRLEANKMTVNSDPFDLEKFLAPLYSMVISLIGKKKIKFHIHKSSNTPKILHTDQKKLNQILMNLLGNSAKFTEEGKINLFIHKIEDKLYFEVSDTGIGIAEEHLEEIFDKFRQIDNSATKEYKGTGLGLNICKRLLEILGGEIKAESLPGSGTTIKFYLPCPETDSDQTEKEQVESNDLTFFINSEKITNPLAFIIEDNRESCYWYANIFRSRDFNLVTCTSSEKALKIISSYHPDILLLKMEMPGIHGLTILKSIERYGELTHMPIVAITHTSELSISAESNPLVLLQEPVNEENIIESIKLIPNAELNKKKVSKLVFYESRNHLKDHLSKNDECYQNEHYLSAALLLTRQLLTVLVLNEIDISGENLKLIKWMQLNPVYIPEKVIIVGSKPFKYITDELEKLPGVYFMSLNSINKFNSLDKVLDNLINSAK